MKYALRIAVVALSLCGGCKKDASGPVVPAPAPSLVGTWQKESTTYVTYVGSQPVAGSDTTIVDTTTTLTLTSTRFTERDRSTHAVGIDTTYTLTNDRLRLAGMSWTYKVAPVTAHELILSLPWGSPSGTFGWADVRYSR